jgi:hypothetical protein
VDEVAQEGPEPGVPIVAELPGVPGLDLGALTAIVPALLVPRITVDA